MSVSVPYPVHSDPLYKFKRAEGTCAPGEPVVDSAVLFSGEACCSDCRGTMTLREGVWVHE